MSKTWQWDVSQATRHVFDQPVRYQPTMDIPDNELQLRKKLIEEEVGETLKGIEDKDIVAITDGIVDSIVVLLGLACSLGVDVQPVWDEVHRTNMAKKGGATREDGKRMKPEGWQPPNILKLLAQQAYKSEEEFLQLLTETKDRNNGI